MLCLPPHTTYDAHPLDCIIFLPLKSQWKAVYHEILQKNPEKVVMKFNFNALFSKAWLESVTVANVIAGFKSCDSISMFFKRSNHQKAVLLQCQLDHHFKALELLQLMSLIQGSSHKWTV